MWGAPGLPVPLLAAVPCGSVAFTAVWLMLQALAPILPAPRVQWSQGARLRTVDEEAIEGEHQQQQQQAGADGLPAQGGAAAAAGIQVGDRPLSLASAGSSEASGPSDSAQSMHAEQQQLAQLTKASPGVLFRSPKADRPQVRGAGCGAGLSPVEGRCGAAAGVRGSSGVCCHFSNSCEGWVDCSLELTAHCTVPPLPTHPPNAKHIDY